MNKIHQIVTALMLFSIPLLAANISGYITDTETGETIIGVNVIVERTEIGAATDINGFFIIRNVRPGITTLRFSHIAYEEFSKTVKVGNKNIYLENIMLKQGTIEAEAVEVTGRRTQLIQKDMDISSFEIDPIVLVETPTLSKDVFKLMKYSPSVTVSDPMSPQYYVRGSDPGENLVQLDGMTIYNPQHFMASQAIFNPYAIKNIEMLVGGFDAEYGGRNSSILNISSREGHQSEVHGEFRPSTSGITGAIEFPVRHGGTAMLSGRIISDLSFRILMGTPNIMADFNGAYQRKIKKTRLRLSAFYARDYMNYSVDNLMIYFPAELFEEFDERFITNTSNTAFGIKTNSLIRPNLILESHIYYSAAEVDNKTIFSMTVEDTSSVTDVELNYKTWIENSISDITAKANLSYFTILGQTLKLGFEISRLRFFNQAHRLSQNIFATRQKAFLQAFYIQDKIEIGKLLLKFGLRNTRYSTERNWRVEPRASLALNLNNLVIKAAYGHYNQYLTTMDSKNDEFIQFLDYYNSLEGQKPIFSIHHIVGIEGKLTETLNYSVTFFYKDLQTLYRFDYDQIKNIFLQEKQLEQGKGKAHGAEFLVRGEVGRLSGWLCYTYSYGTRNYPSILNGKTILFDGDQPHNLKMVLLYKLTKMITASTTFQFTSGYPKTWETGMYCHFSYDPISNIVSRYPTSITPTKNNVRYPPRLIWDIGWKKKLRSGFGYRLAEYIGADDAVFTMTLRNLLFFHRDPQWYFYFPKYGYYGFDFEMIPRVTAGYSIKF